MGRKSAIPEIEQKLGKPIGVILNDMVDQEYKVPEIALELGIKKSLVYELINEFALKSKLKSKSKFRSYFMDSESEFTKSIEHFIITKEIGGKTKKTIRFYKTNLFRYVWWLNQNEIPLNLNSCFTTELIRRFLHYVQTTEIRFGGISTASRKMVSRSTVDAYYRTFQAFGTWLVKEGKLTKSPIEQIEKPKQVKVVVPDIPQEVITAVLNNFDDSFRGLRDKAIVLMLLDTGLRLSELSGIQLADVNTESGLIKVFGKGQKERIIRIGKVAREVVVKYLGARLPIAKNGSLWVTEYGHPLKPEGVRQMLRRLQKQFPDVPLNPHAFRHKFALEYLRAGGDPFTLQMLGGWEDLGMPRRYAAALQQEDALRIHEKASPADNLIMRRETK